MVIKDGKSYIDMKVRRLGKDGVFVGKVLGLVVMVVRRIVLMVVV